MALLDDGFGGYLVLFAAGFLVTEVWRWLGLLVGGAAINRDFGRRLLYPLGKEGDDVAPGTLNSIFKQAGLKR